MRDVNRLHCEMKFVFPEYTEAFRKIDRIFTLTVLASTPLPSELVKLGEDGIRDIWHAEKLRSGGYKRAKEIVCLASESWGPYHQKYGRFTIIWLCFKRYCKQCF